MRSTSQLVIEYVPWSPTCHEALRAHLEATVR